MPGVAAAKWRAERRRRRSTSCQKRQPSPASIARQCFPSKKLGSATIASREGCPQRARLSARRISIDGVAHLQAMSAIIGGRYNLHRPSKNAEANEGASGPGLPASALPWRERGEAGMYSSSPVPPFIARPKGMRQNQRAWRNFCGAQRAWRRAAQA